MPGQMTSKLDNQVGSGIKPTELTNTLRSADAPSMLVKAYKGKQAEAASHFRADSIEMAAAGYFPKWQTWAPGEWPSKAYVLAGVLILFCGVGILVLAYLFLAEPDGTFTVTYEARGSG
jgi:hypothetical protein